MMNMIITRNMKRLILPFLIILVLILSGCAEDGVNANEVDLSSYPSSVQDGRVSVEYYESIMLFYTEYNEWANIIDVYLDSERKAPSVIYNEKHIELFTGALRSYDTVLHSFIFNPKTKADREINEWVDKVVYLQLSFNEAMKEQVVSRGVLDDANTSVKMVLVEKTFQEFVETMNKHNLLK